MRVMVVGGGIIGLSIAWRAAQAGLTVTVTDPDPGGGASHAAAGMLAPVSEVHYGEAALLALNRASLARWPAYADDLRATSGLDVPYRRSGSLLVGFDGDDLRVLEELCTYQEQLGLPVTRLRSRECRDLEPLLSPRIRGGVLVDHEANVDNRAVCAALLVAVERAGGHVRRSRAASLLVEGRRVVGVGVDDGEVASVERVVLAAGAWSPLLDGLPPDAVPPVRPVKGQILRLRFDPARPPLARNVRALVRDRSVYLVPRTNGELVVGATMEEQGFDTSVTAGGIRQLLDAAIDAVPAIADLAQVEAIARLRPATPDNAPVIGPTPIDGLVLATGHHRNGVLLAPITADAVVAYLADGALLPETAGFGIGRFM